LGVNKKDVVDDIDVTKHNEKTIVFNHRPDTYKHFKEFIAMCDRLWEMRQDFKVWIPLLDKPNRDYVVTTKGDKEWYYKELQKCYVGFSPKQKYGGWSVATTDGMMNGVPYIMYDAGYYEELYQQGDFFSDDHDALMLLNTYLDDPQYRNEEASKALDWINNKLIYKDKIIGMNEYMNDLLSKQKVMGDSEKFKEIVEFIKTNKEVRKIDLMDWLCWGRGIKWTPYRRALMNHPNIFDVNSSFPTYRWKD
jgi:glycosyltransferase involved in cell wall biosynthesis